MNGTKKVEDILSDVRIPFSAVPDPYRNAPPCKLNLLELARYADRNGKDRQQRQVLAQNDVGHADGKRIEQLIRALMPFLRNE